jgi:hypothetical protein
MPMSSCCAAPGRQRPAVTGPEGHGSGPGWGRSTPWLAGSGLVCRSGEGVDLAVSGGHDLGVSAAVEGSEEWAGTCELVPRRLRDRRGSGVRLVVIGLAFVAAGAVFLVRGMPWPLGVLTVVFGGAGAVVGLLKVISPGVLVLDGEGFGYQQAIGRTMRESWSDCEDFGVSAVGRTQLVVWRSRRLREAHPRSTGVARAVSGGAEGGLPPGAGGMDAVRLAVLLQRYRESYASSFDGPAAETRE